MVFKSFLIIPILFCACMAADDTAVNPFFDRAEGVLRADYFTCTGDTAQLPFAVLVAWKHGIDSMIGLPDYNAVAKEFQKKTRKSPVSAGPCAVILWKLQRDSIAVLDSIAAYAKAEVRKKRKQIDLMEKRPCDLAAIPFGISRELFLLEAESAGFGELSGTEDLLLCPAVPVGKRRLNGAFHFDGNGNYDRYELESPSYTVDSLDNSVRPLAEYMAFYFHGIIGTQPLHVNRVNRQDIVEGELSLSTVWSEPSWSVAVGFSVMKYRYYAKTIVTNRGIQEDGLKR